MKLPFTPDDIYRFISIDAVRCSPLDDVAACVVRTVDRENDGYKAKIWMVPLSPGEPRQYTQGDGMDSQPRWSPDGSRLAFLSDRQGGPPQIHLIETTGGEARPLGFLPEGASTMEWSPDGTRLLASCAVSVDPECRGTSPANEPRPRAVGAPELAWRLPYKSDGIGYLLGRTFQLFSVDAVTGLSTQLTFGAAGDIKAAGWSPDGTRIVYTRSREGRFAHRTDLWIANADGSDPRRMTSEISSVMSPSWSPDGRWIVFSGIDDDGDAVTHLYVLDTTTEQIRRLGDAHIEVAGVERLRWAADSSRFALVQAYRGASMVTTVSIRDGSSRRLRPGDRQVAHLSMTATRLVYVSERADAPRELFASDWNGFSEVQLTDFNAWWRERTTLRAERRVFQVPNGTGGTEPIEGWLVQSAEQDGAGPLLVDVHGGPNSYAMLGYPWHAYWPVLCSQGWSIIALNPVGSSSYGHGFALRLRGRWGELDFPQHLAAVEQLQREGIADQRVAIAGKSYGGYMAAWAIGHSRIFRAAIVSAPVANLESHYGSSDGGYYGDPYYLCSEPYLDREACRRLSPAHYISNARTPTLFIQGDDDQRCPRGQAEELFVDLMTSTDTPAEMVLYPAGSHHFYEEGRPTHRLDFVQRLLAWLERWIEAPVEQSDGNKAWTPAERSKASAQS